MNPLRQYRAGYTVSELIVAMTCGCFLLLGMSSAIIMSQPVPDPPFLPTLANIDTHADLLQLSSDIQFAQTVSETQEALFTTVLSTTLVVSLLSLTGLTLVRMQKRRSEAPSSRAPAQANSQVGMELALQVTTDDDHSHTANSTALHDSTAVHEAGWKRKQQGLTNDHELQRTS